MEFWMQVFPIALVIFLLGPILFLAKKLFALVSKKEKDRLNREKAEAEEAQRLAYEAAPKCICGELATESLPMLKRSRGAINFFREWFAMPPHYRRVVDKEAPLALCRSHAHVADAMLDHFIHSVRASFCETYSGVAIKAAGFEQEKLMAQLNESLTEAQKRASRKVVAPLRVLPKTGTDSDAGEQQ